MPNSMALAPAAASEPLHIAYAAVLEADDPRLFIEYEVPGAGLMLGYNRALDRDLVRRYLTVVYGDFVDVTPAAVVTA